MLITEQFTNTIIAAYGNHNKDELVPHILVCHGKVC